MHPSSAPYYQYLPCSWHLHTQWLWPQICVSCKSCMASQLNWMHSAFQISTLWACYMKSITLSTRFSPWIVTSRCHTLIVTILVAPQSSTYCNAMIWAFCPGILRPVKSIAETFVLQKSLVQSLVDFFFKTQVLWDTGATYVVQHHTIQAVRSRLYSPCYHAVQSRARHSWPFDRFALRSNHLHCMSTVTEWTTNDTNHVSGIALNEWVICPCQSKGLLVTQLSYVRMMTADALSAAVSLSRFTNGCTIVEVPLLYRINLVCASPRYRLVDQSLTYYSRWPGW